MNVMCVCVYSGVCVPGIITPNLIQVHILAYDVLSNVLYCTCTL